MRRFGSFLFLDFSLEFFLREHQQRLLRYFAVNRRCIYSVTCTRPTLGQRIYRISAFRQVQTRLILRYKHGDVDEPLILRSPAAI